MLEITTKLVSADLRFRVPFDNESDGYQTDWLDIPVNDLNRNVGELINEACEDAEFDDAIEFEFETNLPDFRFWLNMDGLDVWWSMDEQVAPNRYSNTSEIPWNTPAGLSLENLSNLSLGDVSRMANETCTKHLEEHVRILLQELAKEKLRKAGQRLAEEQE